MYLNFEIYDQVQLSNTSVIDEIVKTDEFKKICNQYYLTAGKYVEYVADSEKEQIQQAIYKIS